MKEIVGLQKCAPVQSICRASSYWLNRADYYRRLGQNRRAAALLRHAVTLSPDDGDLREEYAETLLDMSCYEASTRAAFDALTVDPSRFGCYGLIGRSMLALGHEQEALDAFSRFLRGARQADQTPELEEELDDVEDMFDLADTEPRGSARYEALLKIAGRRLARGETDGVKRALDHARHVHGRDERIYTMLSLYYSMMEDDHKALHCARHACKSNAGSVQALCVLASIRATLGYRRQAGIALLVASSRCLYPQEQQMYCRTAMSINMPSLTLAMLRGAQRRHPDRLPVYYDQAITLLKLGQLEEAAACAARCRALDPSDVPSRSTERMISDWQELDMNGEQVRRAARVLPYYPELSPVERQRRLSQIADPLQLGLDVFCQQLCEDGDLYDTFLYALELPGSNMGRLLALVAGALPPEFAEKMLREILVRNAPEDEIKRYAAASLVALGAKPPFVIWHAGRIAEIDPSVKAQSSGSVIHQMLLRRMFDLQRKTGDYRLMTHALHFMLHMSVRQLYQIASDTTFVFRTALEQHYLLTYGLPENDRLHKLRAHTADERRKVNVAFGLLCRLVPIPEGRTNHEDH